MRALVYSAKIGPNASEGARRLALRLRHLRLTQRDLERELGASTGMVSRWLRCFQRPHASYRMALWRQFKIDPEAWDKPPLKPFTPQEAA